MKPKCPKCEESGGLDLSAFDEQTAICLKCGWFRRVSRAAIIRLATEPKKPETCKWKKGGPFGSHSRQCGLLGRYGKWVPSYCEGCGKPVEVGMAEPWKPCPVCGYEGVAGIREGETYRDRLVTCNACEWGIEVRISYRDDFVTIQERCRDEWNDRRTWQERTNG